MGRRKAGKYPYDYTAGDDVHFGDSGLGGTLRVLHGSGRGRGAPEGAECRVQVVAADGTFLDESHAGRSGKEHRLDGTAPRDRVTVEVAGCFDDGEELTTAAGVEVTAERYADDDNPDVGRRIDAP